MFYKHNLNTWLKTMDNIRSVKTEATGENKKIRFKQIWWILGRPGQFTTHALAPKSTSCADPGSNFAIMANRFWLLFFRTYLQDTMPSILFTVIVTEEAQNVNRLGHRNIVLISLFPFTLKGRIYLRAELLWVTRFNSFLYQECRLPSWDPSGAGERLTSLSLSPSLS